MNFYFLAFPPLNFGNEESRVSPLHSQDFSNEGTPLRNTIFTEYERQRSLDMEPIERAYPLEVNPYHEDFRQPFYQESSPQQTYQWQTQHVQQPHRPRQSTWFRGRRKRDVTSSSHPISSTISDQLLMSLVDELNSTRRLTVVCGGLMSAVFGFRCIFFFFNSFC